jgi:small subunit ribosomal protein S6
MRIYEELFIVKPDAPDEEVDQFVEQLRTQLTAAGATVDKVEKWGKRRWPTKWISTAKALTCCSSSPPRPDTVKELERRLRVSDLVIKFLTVRIDETRKRLDKRKKERDKRAAKRAANAPAARPAPGAPPERGATRRSAGHARQPKEN